MFVTAPLRNYRIQSIDLLRGVAMIIMALDHVRDYFNADALRFEPEDLSHTTPLLFFTRWITHFSAPVFAFLAGLCFSFGSEKNTKRIINISFNERVMAYFY